MSPAPAAGWTLPTVVLRPARQPWPGFAVPDSTRRARIPYGTALVGLLVVAAMGGPVGAADDVFDPAGAADAVLVSTRPATEPPTVVARTSLRPLHRPY